MTWGITWNPPKIRYTAFMEHGLEMALEKFQWKICSSVLQTNRVYLWGIFWYFSSLLLFSGCCVVFIVWISILGTVFQLTDTSIKKSGLVTPTACLQSSFHLLKSCFNNHTELHSWLILWSACWVPLFVWVDFVAVLWVHLSCV